VCDPMFGGITHHFSYYLERILAPPGHLRFPTCLLAQNAVQCPDTFWEMYSQSNQTEPRLTAESAAHFINVKTGLELHEVPLTLGSGEPPWVCWRF